MKTFTCWYSILFVAVSLFSPCLAQTGTEQVGKFETGVLLRASDLLPDKLLQGPFHRVREQVETDGYMAYFQIDTDFGTLQAIGIPQVATRIAETGAIAKLVATSKSDLFAAGLKRSIERPIDAVKNIVVTPVESLKKAPSTVGHFFGKVGSSIERTANKIADRNESGEKRTLGEVGSGIGNAAMGVAGFEKARLETARQSGVDPYTDNARLNEEMTKVTWAFFAGGLPLRIVTAGASAGLAVAATEMVGVPEEMYILTKSEIDLRDSQALRAMGLRDDDILDFQNAPALSVTRRHKIVKSLAALSEADHRGNIILLATGCQSPEAADFLVAALAILEKRQTSGEANYNAVLVIGRLPAAVVAGGRLEVPAPVDYVTWTEHVAAFAQREDLAEKPKNLIHTGTFSAMASSGFTEAGWQMTPFIPR